MDSMVNNIQFAKYIIYYQDIIKSIYFSINYKRFEQNLVYNSIINIY